MKEIRVVERYSRALFAAVREQKESDLAKVQEELSKVTERWNSKPQLEKILVHPLISQGEKKSYLRQSLDLKSLSPRMDRFLDLLLENKRIPLLPQIAREYDRLWNDYRRIVPVKVLSAIPLDPGAKENLSQELYSLFQKKVQLKISVTPDLIAGLVIHVGDIVMDNSLKAQLQRLKLRFEHGY